MLAIEKHAAYASCFSVALLFFGERAQTTYHN